LEEDLNVYLGCSWVGWSPEGWSWPLWQPVAASETKTASRTIAAILMNVFIAARVPFSGIEKVQ
jgi:hypothetical protein